MYNIPIEFCIPMKMVRLVKMCLNGTYSRLRGGKDLSDMFPLTNGLRLGDALSSLLFKFPLQYAFMMVDGLKVNGTHQILVYADDANILGGSVHTIKENAKSLMVASKEIGLEVNADKTKYRVMSRVQNAGRNYYYNYYYTI